MATNYSLIFQGQIDVSSINRQIQEIQQRLNKLEFNFGGSAKNIGEVSKGLEDVSKASSDVGTSIEETGLSFQAANEIFSRSIDIISTMFDQVLELDTAITELSKVSDLSGPAMEDYVNKLSQMGSTVARTGKPKRSGPECMDGKHALRFSQNPGSPKALKATA